MRRCETGRVFDVRRFSTHDGGGIRTTVFFKGCPLRCAWCHNPEGISFQKRPVWFSGRCIGCGDCVSAARDGGVRAGETGLRIDPQAREDWDALMDGCPTGALRWDSRDVRVDALMEELRRDAAFFAHGGGVTLSGGDPLMQPEFAREVLLRCRAEGIHTAVETELEAAWPDAQAVLSCADLIYADLKLMDAALHRKYTGADNGRILDNLRRLLGGELGARTVVRTPLIPGVTATQENLTAIARFLTGILPEARYELLNYNPLAAAKYPLVGKRYLFRENPPQYTGAQMEEFRAMVRRCGIRNLICE